MSEANKALVVVARTDEEELPPDTGAPARTVSSLATTIHAGVWRIESLERRGDDGAVIHLVQSVTDEQSPRATIACKTEHLQQLTEGVANLWDATFELSLKLKL